MHNDAFAVVIKIAFKQKEALPDDSNSKESREEGCKTGSKESNSKESREEGCSQESCKEGSSKESCKEGCSQNSQKGSN